MRVTKQRYPRPAVGLSCRPRLHGCPAWLLLLMACCVEVKRLFPKFVMAGLVPAFHVDELQRNQEQEHEHYSGRRFSFGLRRLLQQVADVDDGDKPTAVRHDNCFHALPHWNSSWAELIGVLDMDLLNWSMRRRCIRLEQIKRAKVRGLETLV